MTEDDDGTWEGRRRRTVVQRHPIAAGIVGAGIVAVLAELGGAAICEGETCPSLAKAIEERIDFNRLADPVSIPNLSLVAASTADSHITVSSLLGST